MASLRFSFLTKIPKFIFQQNLRPKSAVKYPNPFLSICSLLASFMPLNDTFVFFSHSNAWAT